MNNALFPIKPSPKSLAPCKRTQHCWMLHFASVCTPCCMLLDVVACCCAKFETGQTFQRTNPNISFVPRSPKHSATMLECRSQHCWELFASVCTPLPTRTQHLPTLLAQHCWELLHPFALHCQHARNLSQHCWRNIVGSCCFRLHAAFHTAVLCVVMQLLLVGRTLA